MDNDILFNIVEKDWMVGGDYNLIKELYENGVKTSGSAGIDLMCMNRKDIELKPGDICNIDTCLRVEIPNGWCGIVVPRSGLGRKGFRLRNTVGIIDSDYRGEILMCIEWIGSEVLRLKRYDRIGQMIVIPCLNIYKYVDKLSDTDRGVNGFGSTGI